MHKKGFTLAEVLITLSIIGVVAALTIPSIVKDYQETQWKVAAKKTYSDLAQATSMLLVENSGDLTGVFSTLTNTNDKYCEYLKCAKQCDVKNATWTNCFHRSSGMKEFGGDAWTASEGDNSAILNNGTLVSFFLGSSVCDDAEGFPDMPACVAIMYDVNGFKGPNQFAKDIFVVGVGKDRIKPYGTGSTGHYKQECANYGWGCTARVLQNIDY